MGKLREEMQLAGLDDRLDGRPPFPTRELLVDHRITLEGKGEDAILRPDRWVGDDRYAPYVDRLTGEREKPWRREILPPDVTRKMLERFQGLVKAPDEAFLSFANRFGLLGLCKQHGLPFTHETTEDCTLEFRESVTHWRRLARRVDAILRIATDLHRSDQYPEVARRLGDESDWHAISDDFDKGWPLPEDLDDAKSTLTDYVNELVGWTAFTLSLEWDQGAPKVSLNPGWTTFGYIAQQLLFFMAGVKDMATCSGCSILYFVNRLPRWDRSNYCPKCSADGAPSKNYKRRKRLADRGEDGGRKGQ